MKDTLYSYNSNGETSITIGRSHDARTNVPDIGDKNLRFRAEFPRDNDPIFASQEPHLETSAVDVFRELGRCLSEIRLVHVTLGILYLVQLFV